MISIDMHVGAFLRSRREMAPLEPREVAEALGIGLDDLQRIEAGRQRATADQVQKFCQLYAVTPMQIYRDALAAAENDDAR